MNLEKKFRIYAKNITVKRLVNYLKIKSSLKLKKVNVTGRPLSLFIEPTNICNLKCPLCPTGNGSLARKKGVMSFEDYKKIIDKLGDTAFSVTLWNYGEPSLNPRFFDMIKYAKSKGLKVITSTNGNAFKKDIEQFIDSGLDELVLAVDGVKKETYEKYRINGNFEEFVNGIKELSRLKKEKNSYFPFMSMQFIIMKNNESEVEDVEAFAKSLGVDELILKTVFLFNDDSKSDAFLPLDKKYSRYNNTGVIPGCDGLWVGVNIDYDGTVVPCCFDYDEKLNLGNIFNDDFNDIWNGSKMKMFREKVYSDKASISICKNCPSNTVSQDYKRVRF